MKAEEKDKIGRETEEMRKKFEEEERERLKAEVAKRVREEYQAKVQKELEKMEKEKEEALARGEAPPSVWGPRPGAGSGAKKKRAVSFVVPPKQKMQEHQDNEAQEAQKK